MLSNRVSKERASVSHLREVPLSVLVNDPLYASIIVNVALPLLVDRLQRKQHNYSRDDTRCNKSNGDTVACVVIRLLSGEINVGTDESTSVTES